MNVVSHREQTIQYLHSEAKDLKIIQKHTITQQIYIQFLINKARRLAADGKTAFDPQGRIVVDVGLEEQDIHDIIKTLDNQLGQMSLQDKKSLEELLGIKITNITTVSLDISSYPELMQQYKEKLIKKLQLNGLSSAVAEVIFAHWVQLPKGSIIALQQEFHCHLALANQVYQQIAADKFENKIKAMRAAHQMALKKTNKLIIKLFTAALLKSLRKDNSINTAKLNRALDKARKILMPQAHFFLMEELVVHTGVTLGKSELKKTKDKWIIHENTAASVAFANDILHIEEGGLATLLTASHAEHGFRQIIVHSHEMFHHRLHIHTAWVNTACAWRVTESLLQTNEEYQLKFRFADDELGVFIFNHFATNLAGAAPVLQGVHDYNIQQLELDNGRPVFCFVQNFFTNNNERDKLLAGESALMTEMALLHTIYDSIRSDFQKLEIRKIFQLYQDYLRQSNRTPFFAVSRMGKQALEKIQALRMNWSLADLKPLEELDVDVNTLAKQALKNLMGKNLHRKVAYAKLFQSLAIFAASAMVTINNEAQVVNGRTALFNNLNEENEMQNHLRQLARGGKKSIRIHAKRLDAMIDRVYNQKGLHQAASLLNLANQGSASNIACNASNSLSRFLSSNQYEHNKKIMFHLAQSNTRAMLPQKRAETMRAAWQGYPRSWWFIMQSKWGTVGAVVAILLVVPAIIVALYQRFDNAKRHAKAKAICDTALEKYQAAQIKEGSINIIKNACRTQPQEKMQETANVDEIQEEPYPKPEIDEIQEEPYPESEPCSKIEELSSQPISTCNIL